MMPYRIENAVSELTSIFLEAGYTENSVTELKRNVQKVVNLHKEYNEPFYSSCLVEKYISKLEEMHSNGLMSRSRKNGLRKAAFYVREIAITGTVQVGAKELKDKLTPYYRAVVEEIRLSKDWGDTLNCCIRYVAHTYFRFLADNDIFSLDRITEETVRCYIIQKASTLSPNSLDTTRRNLKHLHQWMYKKQYVSHDFSDILSFTTPHYHKIKKPVPHDEIALMFQKIDRHKCIGKRDYAILMIAIVTGMRSSDIINLKFSNIDWTSGEIRVCQKKTDKFLALPLTTDVGEAIKDYILHGRPKSGSEIIFLSSRPPFKPLENRGVYSAFNHIRARAGLNRCPFHSLRRAVGTSMVVAGVPVTTVAQVLGHSAISSTKPYISLDSIHLKKCALGLEGIAQDGGETQ